MSDFTTYCWRARHGKEIFCDGMMMHRGRRCCSHESRRSGAELGPLISHIVHGAGGFRFCMLSTDLPHIQRGYWSVRAQPRRTHLSPSALKLPAAATTVRSALSPPAPTPYRGLRVPGKFPVPRNMPHGPCAASISSTMPAQCVITESSLLGRRRSSSTEPGNEAAVAPVQVFG